MVMPVGPARLADANTSMNAPVPPSYRFTWLVCPSETSRLPSRPITRPSGSPRAEADTLTKAPVVRSYSRTVWSNWLATSRPLVIISLSLPVSAGLTIRVVPPTSNASVRDVRKCHERTHARQQRAHRNEFEQLQISFSQSAFLYLIPTLHV